MPAIRSIRHESEEDDSLNLPRFARHPRSHGSAIVIHLVARALLLSIMLVVGPPLMSAAPAQALRFVGTSPLSQGPWPPAGNQLAFRADGS